MRFADHFWNEQSDQFTGFATLSQKLKDGKHFCRDYVDFLKQRAHLEETYGKALIKVSRAAGGKDEIGSLRNSWESLRQETESIGHERVSLASKLLEEASSVQEAAEAHRQRRKQAEEQVHRLQSARKTAHKKLLEIRASYVTKSHQTELLGQALLAEMSKSNIHPKDIEKLKQKYNRCMVVAEQADHAYKAALDALEDLRLAWETETVVVCDLFQELEEKRIHILRNSMWLIANHNSKTCCTDDDNYETVRQSLEKCSPEGDIDLFIKEKQTGQQRPVAVPYVSYQSEGVQPQDNGKAIIIPCSPSTVAKKIENWEPTLKEKQNTLYDTVDVLFPWRVLGNYLAQSDFELSLLCDEYVRVTNQTDRDWWQVLTEDGRSGYYPSQLLQYGAHVDSV